MECVYPNCPQLYGGCHTGCRATEIVRLKAELAELKGQWERLLEAYSAAKARSEQ